MLIFNHFIKAAFGALGVPIGQNKFQNRIQHSKNRVQTYFCQEFSSMCAGQKCHKIGRIDFLPFFDCDLETLAIEISEI